MSDLMGMTVEELLAHMSTRSQRLPFEIGAFVALEVCESLMDAPAVVTTRSVRITDEGVVSVFAPPNSASGAEAARSVAGVLASLLVAAGSGVPPMLLQLVEQGPSDGRWDLGRLRDELEASLVPLNRSAARRVLSRLVRDLRRPPRRASQRPPSATAPATTAPPPALPAEILDGDPDADLDALLGDELGDAGALDGLDGLDGLDSDLPSDELPTQQLPQLDGSGNPVVDFADVAAKRSAGSPGARRESPGPAPASAPSRVERGATRPEPAARRPAPSDRDTPELASAVAQAEPRLPREEGLPAVSSGRLSELDGFDEVGSRSQGRWGLAIALLLVVAGLAFGAIFVFRPDVVGRMTGEVTEPDPEAELAAARAEQERLRQQAEAELRARHGDLTVRASSDHAQILLFVGRGPAVAENLPVGVAHEFVAIADGKEPTRAVVPADGEWAPLEDGTPQYELAMQTGERAMTFEEMDLGASRLERGAMGTPTGALGRVRVVTTPPGAKVYLLIGFGSAHVTDLATEEPRELIVFEEGGRPQRVFVGPSDWREGPDGKVAEVEVNLEER